MILIATICTLPYCAKSILTVTQKWRELERVIDALNRSQLIETGSELTSQMLAISRRSSLVPPSIDLNEAIVSFADMDVRVLHVSIKLEVKSTSRPRSKGGLQ